jgi:hypothetical protein
VRKDMKKIIAFVTPSVAIGTDMVKPSPPNRLVHGKSKLLNRKGQQKLVDSVSFACSDKKESRKTISYQNNRSGNDEGYIIPLGAPVYQTTRHQLYQAVGVDPEGIDDDFELVNVSPNGNCALLVVQQFLHSTGREKNMSITQFRQMLFEYINANKETFQRVTAAFPHGWMYPNSQWEHLLLALYKPGINFDTGCSPSYWVDIMAIGPILAHKYHITLSIYGDQPITVRYLEGLGIRAQAALAPALIRAPHTLFSLFHGYHYYWIKPRKEHRVFAER